MLVIESVFASWVYFKDVFFAGDKQSSKSTSGGMFASLLVEHFCHFHGCARNTPQFLAAILKQKLTLDTELRMEAFFALNFRVRC